MMKPIPYERRFKIAYLSSEVLLNCLCLNASTPGVKTSLDVPDGTVVMGRHFDFARGCEAVILYNPAWPLIEMAALLPEIKVTVSYVQAVSAPESEPMTTVHYDGVDHRVPQRMIEPAPKSKFEMTPATRVPGLAIKLDGSFEQIDPAPKSVEDPFMKIWREKELDR